MEHFFERGRVLSKNCPSRAILQHLTSRWGGLVMVVLQQDKKRFSELKREIEGISERMLTQTLQQLEADGMIHRQSFHTVPPHVEYRLTELGRQAAERIFNLVDWLEVHLNDVLAAQKQSQPTT